MREASDKITTFNKGMTLVEILVVIAIAGVLMGVMFTQQSTFHDTVLLRNTAYELALTVREAQAYGTGVRLEDSGDTGNSYGVHIDLAAPTLIFLYSDDGDDLYEIDEQVKSIKFTEPHYISDFCATNAITGAEECSESDNSIIGLEIIFVRPEPNPRLFIVYSDGTTNPITQTRISVATPQGGEVDVLISKTGHVAVE